MNATTPPQCSHETDLTTLSLQLRGLRKSFGETIALDGLDLDAVSGEILGIAGPNGAGKSTLVRILAGEEARDAGRIEVDGRLWEPGDPADPVAVVHQEPQLWANLTVAQNLLVGREGQGIAFPRLGKADRSILDDLEIGRLADTPLEACSLAVRQRTEIGRALARDARLFLFDEPNSALTEEESNRLFAWMHELADQGRLVLLVTHRLAEMVAHCDRAVVIRDGQVRAELAGPTLTDEHLARELVVGAVAKAGAGPADSQARPSPDRPIATKASRAAATLDDWTGVGRSFRGVKLVIREGEVFAVVGVEGSGARELVASVAGFQAGTGVLHIEPDGASSTRVSTAYLSADRRGTLFANLSVGENLVVRLGRPDIGGPAGLLLVGRLRRLAEDLVARFQVRTASAKAPLTTLSGGNQQKVAIAAAIAGRPRVLVLEEPTRGVDVGSKAEIYRILRDFASEGHAVLVYCTEVPEVYELADRFLIIDDGRPTPPMEVDQFPDVVSLAAAIARGEHTDVGTLDLEASHARGRSGEDTTRGGHQ